MYAFVNRRPPNHLESLSRDSSPGDKMRPFATPMRRFCDVLRRFATQMMTFANICCEHLRAAPWRPHGFFPAQASRAALIGFTMPKTVRGYYSYSALMSSETPSFGSLPISSGSWTIRRQDRRRLKGARGQGDERALLRADNDQCQRIAKRPADRPLFVIFCLRAFRREFRGSIARKCSDGVPSFRKGEPDLPMSRTERTPTPWKYGAAATSGS